MEKLVNTLAKLSRMIADLEESARDQFGIKELTITQMNYLETISQLVNPSLTELARELSLTKPTVKVVVDKLIDKGYVLRVKSDEDRRSAHLHLTDKGKQINQTHDLAHLQMAEMFSQQLDETELALLRLLLEKVFK